MSRGTIVSLFDYSGVMVKPWVEAGYDAVCVDVQHEDSRDGNIYYINKDLMEPVGLEYLEDIVFVAAFPPCDHLAVSGARWFKGKGLRKLADSINMFATAAEFCEESGAPYLIENPVSTISTYWRKPDYKFHPHYFTGYVENDNYTKNTCLWTGGGFKMPDPYQNDTLGDPDNRIHMAPPGKNQKQFRSQTPEGFAQAVFEANATERN